MKNEHLIQLYFDGSLEKGREEELFALLAGNPDEREYFNNLHRIRRSIESGIEPFPQQLEERILRSLPVNGKSSMFRRFTLPFAYAAAALLLIACLYFYDAAAAQKQRAEDAYRLAGIQSLKLELMYNSLPAARIYGQDESGIIIKSNM